MIISIANNKGGVGKTTTVVNLGHALAKAGKRVLVVDMDHQSNLSINLKAEERRRSLYELMDPTENSVIVEECIYPSPYKGLDILPNIEETAILEPYLMRTEEGMGLFRKRFREYALTHYDVVLIDNAPALGTFVINALRCSDFVIVPISAGSKHSISGLIKALKFIDEEQVNGNPDLRFLKLLITNVDKRRSIHKDRVAQVQNMFDEDKFFQTVIPLNTDVEKAEDRDKSVLDWKPSAAASTAYKKLAQELISAMDRIKENGDS